MTPMRRRTLIVAALSLAALPASAQTGLRLDGSYVFDSARSEDPNAAVNRAVATLNVIVRQMVRPRLRSAALPPRRLEIAIARSEVTLTFNDQPPLIARTNGTPVRWARGGGDTMEARAMLAADALTLVLEDGEYTHTHVYRPADARSLTVETSIASPKLRVPVTYRTFYARQ